MATDEAERPRSRAGSTDERESVFTYKVHARYRLTMPASEEQTRDARITQYLRVANEDGHPVITNINALTRLVDEAWFAGAEYAGNIAREHRTHLEGELKRLRTTLDTALNPPKPADNGCGASPQEIRRDGGPYDTYRTAGEARNPLRPDGDDPPHG